MGSLELDLVRASFGDGDGVLEVVSGEELLKRGWEVVGEEKKREREGG